MLQERKKRHIDACLSDPVQYVTRTTGLERLDLPYMALPNSSLAGVDLSTEFLGRRLAAPVLIGAMTGGAKLAATINRNLAAAAQELGIGMMLGSQRVMLVEPDSADTFAVRDVAPDILLIGNIGLAQLGNIAPAAQLNSLVRRVGADALAVHTNPLQEAVQPGGDTDFTGQVYRLAELTHAVEFPVLLKEVGHGISGAAARRLGGCRLAAIDVAGAGGTSWARVEQFVRFGAITSPELAEWGIPTAEALVEVHAELPHMPLIGSGGIRTGMDAAKAIALGASVVSVALPLLAPAVQSPQAVVAWLQQFLDELRIAMHCADVNTIADLRRISLRPRSSPR
ncbi:type 2 isopentenyl-diphosphate Delta-isomerase [Mycobacteroides abscessus]|nr:type 2 isopentenyl-diphosphate Delta-isomerase [Mycobacteroides abscessus subsp. massiliense]PVA57517.1 type 2 isopentenyl-diphosphate Delta-isomerase [Mycobacteroides abscessus]TKV36339.1 type 2 isopentenyl-diphosphate Delta-isomerase [Mycobacteroides abscessus subsp. bolletii]PVA95661.1 type 2 isopentenyl-diphosphate Delta-isomerase [Mycobacteroides abscessus]PVB04851.1 type 2 isopentenyl-diphosphate Delta-isomerase [Mycobacteroides abscessus]